MTIIPFVCLGVGIGLGVFIKTTKLVSVSDKISTFALIFLMLSIGMSIGLDESIVNNFAKIGFNCVVISVCAIGFSVLFTFICEKTVLPLDKINRELQQKNLNLLSIDSEKSKEDKINEVENQQESEKTPLVWIMPLSIILGLLMGIIFRGRIAPSRLDVFFTIFLIILYICVGISQGANKEVFNYIKLLGLKIIWLSAAILFGSITGGIVAGMLLKIPLYVPVISASGMSFYSITGAYMSQSFGVEVGTYGFIVNVLREFFTVLSMPLLIKISLGSPIAGGAAGNMDTMLAPVTKFVGVQLGLVTLITGTILTFIVPFLLPLLTYIFY